MSNSCLTQQRRDDRPIYRSMVEGYFRDTKYKGYRGNMGIKKVVVEVLVEGGRSLRCKQAMLIGDKL